MSGGFANFTFIASSRKPLTRPALRRLGTIFRSNTEKRSAHLITVGTDGFLTDIQNLFSAVDPLPYPGVEPTALLFTVFEPKTNTFNHIYLQLIRRVFENAAPLSILDDATMKYEVL